MALFATADDSMGALGAGPGGAHGAGCRLTKSASHATVLIRGELHAGGNERTAGMEGSQHRGKEGRGESDSQQMAVGSLPIT